MSEKQFPPPEKAQASTDSHTDHEDHVAVSVDDVATEQLEIGDTSGADMPDVDHADGEAASVDPVAGTSTAGASSRVAGAMMTLREDRAMMTVLMGGIAFGAIILAAVIGFSLGQESTGKADGVCQSVSVWGDGDRYRELDSQGGDTRAKFEMRFEQGSTSACVGGVVDGAPAGLAGLLPMMGTNGAGMNGGGMMSDSSGDSSGSSSSTVPEILEQNGIEIPADLQPLVDQYTTG